MKIYLCGPINGRSDDDCNGWREYAGAKLVASGHTVLDPMARDYRGRELEDGIADVIVAGDEQDIASCDVLLIYYDKPSVGTSMEIRMAVKEMGKRVVLVDKSDKPLSPWLIHHCPERYKTLDEGIAAL